MAINVVYGLPQAINPLPTVLTIGAFDGLHRGHAHLIGGAVQRARALGCQSAVLTFEPHPDAVVYPERPRLVLTDADERTELVEALGVDLLLVVPFTAELMALPSQAFMTQVTQAVALRELWVGYDFALGRRREGDAAKLAEIGRTLGYNVHPVEPLTLDGQVVSSTRIRAALEVGDVPAAARLLGRLYSLRGIVVEGDKRGRTIGFPTANIAVDAERLVPHNGVYVCHATVGGERYGAVTNIGVRPTFDGTRRTVEAYLLDFAGDIYGEVLRLEFAERLRGEQKFHGIAALVAQITGDVAAAREQLARG